jgi:hypothetical protein
MLSDDVANCERCRKLTLVNALLVHAWFAAADRLPALVRDAELIGSWPAAPIL